MPIISIQIADHGTTSGASVTAEEKCALVKGVSTVLLDVLKTPLDSTLVLIHELPMENWGKGGLPLEKFLQLQAPKAD